MEEIYLNNFEIYSFISNNFLTILIGIVGLSVSIHLYRKGRKKKQISYATSSYNVIKNGVDSQINGEKALNKIEILFNNEKIPNLTITKIAFWNSGNIEIKGNDIVIACPYFIEGDKDCNILSADVITEVEPNNQFKIELIDNHVSIKFDYMNICHGIVIQLIHTGDREMLKYDGKLIGGKELRENKKNGSLVYFLLNKLEFIDKPIYDKAIAMIIPVTNNFIFIYLAVFAMIVNYFVFIDNSYIKLQAGELEAKIIYVLCPIFNLVVILGIIIKVIRKNREAPKSLKNYDHF